MQKRQQPGTEETPNGEQQSRVEKRAVKLHEIGPRMSLRLVKVEEGMCEGRVMWNEFVSKTKDERKELDQKWDTRRKEKEERRKVQKENVERKRAEKEAKKSRGKAEVSGDKKEEEEDDSEEEWDTDEAELAMDDEMDVDEPADDVESEAESVEDDENG